MAAAADNWILHTIHDLPNLRAQYNLDEMVDPINAASRRGKFTPYLNGRIVIGPDKDSLYCCLAVWICYGTIFGLQYPLIVEMIGYAWAIFGVVLLTMTFLSYLCTALTDPGVMPKGERLDENWWRNLRYQRDLAAGYRSRYCRKCHTVRPPRTYHCDICNVCIRYQDMHLFIAGTCVGERNNIPYLTLNLLQCLLAIYIITIDSIVFTKTYNKDLSDKLAPNEVVLTVVSFFLGFVILLAPQTGVLMLLYRFYLLAQNRTLREEFRALQGIGVPHQQNKNYIANFASAFSCRDKGKSCFRTKLNQVGSIPFEMDMERTLRRTDFRFMVPPFESEMEFLHDVNQNFVQEQEPISGPRVRWPRRDLTVNLRETSKSKKSTCQSVPLIKDGELPLLPGDRIPLEKNARASSSLQKQIKRFHQVQKMPKPFIDFHRHHQVPSTLSFGGVPRTPMTRDVVNGIKQEARAAQIQRILEFILARDRRGLVQYAQRLDLGGIMGSQNPMDANDFQVIELGRQGQNTQEIAEGILRDANQPAGLPQLRASGLLASLQVRMARYLNPHNLNALRNQYIHDYDPDNIPVTPGPNLPHQIEPRQDVARSSIPQPSRRQGIPTRNPNVGYTRIIRANARNPFSARTNRTTRPTSRRRGQIGQIQNLQSREVEANIRAPTTQNISSVPSAPVPANIRDEFNNNNSVVVVFVNSPSDRTDQATSSNVASGNINLNPNQ